MNQKDLQKKIRQVLKKVMDPEIGINVVDLGLVYAIEVGKKKAYIEMTFTTAGCPIIPYFLIQVRRAAESIDEIDEAEVEIVWEPAWNQSMISEEGMKQIQMKKKQV